MILLSIALGLLAAILFLPSLSDAVSVVRVARRGPVARSTRSAQTPRLLFLVPAHNEELLLPACLVSLRAMHYPGDRVDVVVVADNCTDRTAVIAQVAGVRCLVRNAPTDPGKPRAIAWALAQVRVAEYDAVAIVDADTEVDREFAAQLATAAPLTGKALQPYNGVSNRTENALTRMSAVLSAANHGLAYVLKTRAGVSVPLSAGMCIGSEILAAHGWTVSSLSEDWELYALLTTRGVSVEGVPGALIRAQEAASLQAGGSQRRRWTAGKVGVLLRYAWPLMRSREAGAARKLDALAELTAVGPVLHAGIVSLAVAATALVRPPGWDWIAAVLLAGLLRPLIYTVIAMGSDPEPMAALRAFLFLPFYAVWRLYTALTTLAMLGGRPWVRTARGEPVRSELPKALDPTVH
jgi:cellulose synthase/poly-beta-1,6-N-acetylglucosamine synthase-like glycosyltransferase